MQEIEKRASEIIQKKIKQRKYRLKKKKKNSNNRHKLYNNEKTSKYVGYRKSSAFK